VQIGDWHDMPSLSAYDRGRKAAEGADVQRDIDTGNAALRELMGYFPRWYRPRLIHTRGNHEQRIARHVEAYPWLRSMLGYHLLDWERLRWETHDFLIPVTVDGISYAHFFPRAANGRIMQTKHGAPSARAQVMRELASCSAGHMQGLDFATHSNSHRCFYGIILGSTYLHDESYLPGRNSYWRGVVLKTNVRDGEYSPQFLQLDTL